VLGTARNPYYPDATFETKTGRSYIFEVMDSEADRQALVVAHVLEAVFGRGVQKVFFIVQSVRDQNSVEHVARIVLANLEDLSGWKNRERNPILLRRHLP